jgi:hypothetical protein
LRGNIGSNLSDADCSLMDIIANVFDGAGRSPEAIDVYRTIVPAAAKQARRSPVLASGRPSIGVPRCVDLALILTVLRR